MKKHVLNILILSFLMVTVFMVNSAFSQPDLFYSIDKKIEEGYFKEAAGYIDSLVRTSGISQDERYELLFRLDRMERIKKDFNRSEEQILNYIKSYIPEANEQMMRKWEQEKSLEVKIIDGARKYFSQAGPNLFRIEKEAGEKKTAKDGIKEDKLNSFLKQEIPDILANNKISPAHFLFRKKIQYKYTLTVNKNAVPDGEIIRAWLPYPMDGNDRQKQVELLKVNNKQYLISPPGYLHKTIYMEQPAKKDSETVFSYELTYSACAELNQLDLDKLKITGKDLMDMKKFTGEEFPHIVFSDEIKQLSKKITGEEKDKGKIVKLIFTWISKNIPWASAREYSTIPNISMYCLNNGHGDCGIQTLLFMTLCRYNGIPAKWQSGWMLHPGSVNLHDWCQVYLDDYGWVPVDQSFGLQQIDGKDADYFYLGNTDSYHFIVNDGIAQPLYPAKIYPRSETIDFQRGEVEWKGGNLYFDQWNYSMKVDYSFTR